MWLWAKSFNNYSLLTPNYNCVCASCSVVRSHNPCAVGSSGIVIAEKQQVLQICTPANKIISKNLYVSWLAGVHGLMIVCALFFLLITAMPKQGSRFRVALDDRRAVLIEGEWLNTRAT